MGFINNITGGGTSGGTASNSVSSKIVDELKVDVAVVETKVNRLPFDITCVTVDTNFDLNNFFVTNVPTPTAPNQIFNNQIYTAPNSPKFGTSATSKDYVHSYVKDFLTANIESLIMMDGNYHSCSNEFIKNNASGHWLISDNSSSKVSTYGVLSGTNFESLQYQGFGERKNIVKYSDIEKPTSGAGLINGKYKYLTFDGINDRMKCNMDLNITSGNKTLSTTIVYRMRAYGTGVGLKNGLIRNDNTGWDHFISMNDSKKFIVSNAKKESTSYNGGDNITCLTFSTKANPTELNKWIVVTVTWSPQLGADGSQVWCNGQKLRSFTAKENIGATHFSIDSLNANGVAAPLAGDIAELMIFKQEDELNNASTIKRIQKHLIDKYAITHKPMLSM